MPDRHFAWPGSYRGAVSFTVDDARLTQVEQRVEAWRAAVARGHEVGNHTVGHPCGETHVGRGTHAASYVPLVADRYLAGRGYRHDHPNDPRYCDLAHLLSYRFDIQPAEQHIAAMEHARETGAWVILSGHEIGGPEEYMLNVSIPRLRAVLDFLGERGGDLWVAPVAEVARWIAGQRGNVVE